MEIVPFIACAVDAWGGEDVSRRSMAYFHEAPLELACFQGWVEGVPEYEHVANFTFALRFPNHPFSRLVREDYPDYTDEDLFAFVRDRIGAVAESVPQYVRRQAVSILFDALDLVIPIGFFVLVYGGCVYFFLSKFISALEITLPRQQVMILAGVIAVLVYISMNVYEKLHQWWQSRRAPTSQSDTP